MTPEGSSDGSYVELTKNGGGDGHGITENRQKRFRVEISHVASRKIEERLNATGERRQSGQCYA